MENITFSKIKQLIGYKMLYLNALKDSNGNKSEVFIHFDNEDRVAVQIHNDVITAIKEDEYTALNFTKKIKQWRLGTYTTFEITTYEPL